MSGIHGNPHTATQPGHLNRAPGLFISRVLLGQTCILENHGILPVIRTGLVWLARGKSYPGKSAAQLVYLRYVRKPPPPSSLEASEELFSPLRRADGVLHGPSTEIEKLFSGADSGRLLMSTATYPPISVDTRTCQSRTVFYVGMPMREDKDGEGICNTKRNALAADLEICVGTPVWLGSL